MKARFLALAALVLGLASCQTEPEGLNVNVGGEVDATIAISIPETETRYGDGSNSALGVFNNGVLGTENDNVTMRYLMQIFDNNGRPSDTYYVDYSDGKTVNFDVRLVPNRNYTFVVWADVVVNGEADVDNHYNTKNAAGKVDLTNISLKGVWNPMDESRDAFTVTELVKNYTGASIINLELKRPFAKLRIVTTDMEQLNDLDIMPSKATVEYTTTHYGAFNAYEGKVIGDSKNRNIKHENFAIVKYDEDVQNDADKTIFTDYFFAKSEDEVVNFTLAVYDQNGVIIGKETNFNTPIPARRNYLTTISGNILTDGNNVKVDVQDAFANAGTSTNAPYYQETISSVAELLAAIDANNGKYILISNLDVNDVTVSTLAATRAAGTGAGTTINLNGYTIKLQKDIVIPEGNTLIINNDSVDDAGNDEGAIVSVNGKAIVNNGTLIIEGGNFGENTIVNNGTANVSGGNFADDAIVNNGSVSVEGDNSGKEDRIIENGTNAVVSNIVYTVEELQDALNEGKVDEIIFGANLVGDATISQREGVNVNINGADKKFDGTIYVYGGSRDKGKETLKIANINFETESAKYFIYANYRTEPERYAHNVTIENCTFRSLAGDNSVEVCGASFRQAFNVTIKDCTATNTFYLAWFTGSVGTTIEGCKAINNYEGITVGNGATSVVKNTEISSSTYGLRFESNHSNYSDTHYVTIENCNLNAFIPVSVRSLTTGKFNLALQGDNKLTRGGLYDIALCSNEYKEGEVAKTPTCEWTISGANDYIVFPREYAVKNVEQIAEALTLKSKVLFAADIKGDVYIAQQENFNVVIDGRKYKFDGTFTIDGKNRNNGAETLTLKNITFYTESTDEKTFISCPSTYNGVKERYSHNVTIDGCTFSASTLTDKVGAISAQKTYHLAVKNCEAYNIHSLLQVQSCDNDVTVENVKVENCFSGISVGNTKTTTISGANIKTQKYGIRLDGETSRNVTVNVANSNIEAYIPIVARKVTTGCNVYVNLTETTLVKNNNDMLDVVFQNNKDYDDGNVTPVAPTGKWNITGADDFIVYPRDVVSSWDEFTAALAAEKTFFLLGADITYDKSYTITKDVTIDLNGKTFEISNASARLNIGDKDNITKPNVTIKNGNLNCKVYALSGNLTIQDVAFGGTIEYAGDAQGVISTKHASLLMESCNMKTVKKGSTKPRSICTEGRSSGSLIFRDCDFINSNLDRPYINPLNGNAVLEITDCRLFGGASNIDLGASYVWSNLNLTGCSGGFTFTISRASTSLTEEELTIYRAIKQNNSGSKRFIFTDGEKNNL